MDYPETYIVADTVARELRTRIADLTTDKITLLRDEAVLIIAVLDAMMKGMEDEVRQTNGSKL